jgi:hypothetical protein
MLGSIDSKWAKLKQVRIGTNKLKGGGTIFNLH